MVSYTLLDLVYNLERSKLKNVEFLKTKKKLKIKKTGNFNNLNLINFNDWNQNDSY